MSQYQPGMRVSEYKLEEQLGAGTFGEVWRARHHVWQDDEVAIKLPTQPDYVRYLQREGLVVHGLRHKNIVRVMGMDPYAEHPYLTMELVKGPSLRGVLNESPGGLPIDATRTILQGILRGLIAAHEANVVHRDLKPGNILLHLDGRPLDAVAIDDVKVVDFGLGLSHGETLRSIAQSASLAREDSLVGTVAYMAPEVRDGSRDPDARSDLYAVGVILFEMLVGERPAGVDLPTSVRADLPKAVDEIFRRFYSRYDKRFESARAALQEVEARLSHGARVVPPPPPPIVSRPVNRPAPTARRCACGNACDPDDQFCVMCGKTLVDEVRRCPACQAYPGPDDNFCILCGASLPALKE